MLRRTLWAFGFIIWHSTSIAQGTTGDAGTVTQSSFPQSNPNLIPPSPQAYSFNRYGSLPIGINTGTVQYSLPFYTIRAGHLSYTIAFSYASNGVRVDEMSTRVGMNWTMKAGGAITRTIRDRPDGGAGVTPAFYHGPIVTDTSNPQVWTFYNFVKQASYSDIPDFEPDEYSYNIDGYSGKFIKRESGIYTQYNPDGVKIEKLESSFQLTAPDGVRYVYGISEQTRAYMFPLSETLENISTFEPTAWLLTKIKSPFGDSIVFNYSELVPNSSINFINGISQNFSTGTNDFEIVNTTEYGTGTRSGLPYVNASSVQPAPPGLVTNIQFSESYSYILNSVVFPGGTVNFYYSGREDIPSEKKLDSLKVIRNSDNRPIKSAMLNYIYSNANPTTYDTYLGTTDYTSQHPELRKRLFLVAYSDRANDNSQTSTHQFDYDSIQMLPPRLSFAQDRYGGFNGKINTYFYPNDTWFDWYIGGLHAGGDRTYNLNYSRRGMLKKITYPTGGQTEFEYESNRTSTPYAYTYLKDSVVAVMDTSTADLQVFYSDTLASATYMRLRGSVSWGSVPVDNGGPGGYEDLQDQYYVQIEVINAATNSVCNAQFCSTVAAVGETFELPDFGYYLPGGNYFIRLTSSRPRLRARVVLERSVRVEDVGPFAGICGVRVKSITDYSMPGKKSGVRKFIYNPWGSPTISTGNGLNIDANNGNEVSMTRLIATQIHLSVQGVTDYWSGYNTIHSNSVHATFSTENNTVVYSKVIEVQEGFSDSMKRNGGIEYEFYFDRKKMPIPVKFTWGTMVWDPYPYVPPGAVAMNNDGRTGKLKKQTNFVYQTLHGARTLLNESSYYWSVDSSHMLIDTFTVSRNVVKLDVMNPLWPYFVCYDMYRYWAYFGFLKQDSVVTITYAPNVQLRDKASFTAYNLINYLPSAIDYTTSAGENRQILRTYTTSPSPLAPDYPLYAAMKAANQINSVLVESESANSVQTTRKRLSFGNFNGLYLPDSSLFTVKTGSEYVDTKLQQYDALGNLQQYTGRDGVINSIIWGYNGRFPVAKIAGKSYNDIVSLSGINMALVVNPLSDASLQTELDKLRAVSGASVSSFIYEPLIGVKKETDLNGMNSFYEYDMFGRLSIVRDNDRNVVKRICYDLQGQPSSCGYGSNGNWQPFISVCETNASNQYTGNLIVTEKDLNPLSASFNTTRVKTLIDTSACSITCSSMTCVGVNKKCVNGICETGVKICVSSIKHSGTSWTNTFYYKWSDNSTSQTYTVDESGVCSSLQP